MERAGLKGVVVGLGRVGLPVSHHLAGRFDLLGIDVSHVEGFPGEMLKLDVTDESPDTTQALEDAVRGAEFVLYTAILNPELAIADPGMAGTYETDSLAVNALGAGKVFALGSKHNVPRLVYYSTLQVYGAPSYADIDCLTEEIPPDPGIIPGDGWERFVVIYAHAKLAGEQQLAKYSSTPSQGIVLRLAAPRGDEVFKETNHWHYTHMDDVSHATEQAITASLSQGDAPFSFGVFHIAQDHPDSNFSIQHARDVLGYRPRHKSL